MSESRHQERPLKRKPTVLLADDHKMVAEAMRRLLDRHFDVLGIAENGQVLLESARALHPELVVLDINMPVLNGLDAGRQLKREMPEVKVVFLTCQEAPGLAEEALRAGASGYLLKRGAASELKEAMDAVVSGGTYVTRLLAPIPASS